MLLRKYDHYNEAAKSVYTASKLVRKCHITMGQFLCIYIYIYIYIHVHTDMSNVEIHPSKIKDPVSVDAKKKNIIRRTSTYRIPNSAQIKTALMTCVEPSIRSFAISLRGTSPLQSGTIPSIPTRLKSVQSPCLSDILPLHARKRGPKKASGKQTGPDLAWTTHLQRGAWNAGPANGTDSYIFAGCGFFFFFFDDLFIPSSKATCGSG